MIDFSFIGSPVHGYEMNLVFSNYDLRLFLVLVLIAHWQEQEAAIQYYQLTYPMEDTTNYCHFSDRQQFYW